MNQFLCSVAATKENKANHLFIQKPQKLCWLHFPRGHSLLVGDGGSKTSLVCQTLSGISLGTLFGA